MEARRVSVAVLLFVPRLFYWIAQLLRLVFRGLIYVFIAVGIWLGIGYVAFRSDRDVAYRYLEPEAAECQAQNKAPLMLASDDKDTDNDELAAIERGRVRADALACMVQTHQVLPPYSRPGAATLRYHLGFLEFAEDGRPADTNAAGDTLQKNQLAALLKHLRDIRGAGRHNYVIAFIHGWRHNASIGDADVQKLRVIAAYTASFLRQRCEALKRDCDTEVTAVYVGWRGARIDERAARRVLGANRVSSFLDKIFGEIPALLTLFDRKPVSERIGPAVVTALRRVDDATYGRSSQGLKVDRASRMITFGHSLGGNLLASTLRDVMLDRIARHAPGTIMSAPFGDLIALLNPASEASNWTMLQRAMRTRFQFSLREIRDEDAVARETREIVAGQRFFHLHQPPIYIALGSAATWPAGRIRKADLNYLRKLVTSNDREELGAQQAAKLTCEELKRRNQILDRPRYDWATHDLFPAFKFDFRAFAETLEEKAKGSPSDDLCKQDERDGDETILNIWGGLAAFLRNFPFMNTDIEQTRTIGHLIPQRSPIGSLENGAILPSTFYGTTHELTFNLGGAKDAEFVLASYRWAADPTQSECAVVDHWLWWARMREPPWGAYWHSGHTEDGKPGRQNVTPIVARTTMQDGRLESEFRHGMANAGMAAIVRGNDPFWNVRVFETGMRDHGDYTSYPLMCAIQQLVMDRVADPHFDLP